MAGLEDLSIVEVLDLREDLRDYLPHFRSEMVRLSEDVSAMETADIANEIDRRWHLDLAPVLEEIRRAVAKARYPRKLIDVVTSDAKSTASLAGSLALAAGSLAAGLGSLIPAVTAAAYPFVKARMLAEEEMEKARQNKLFFLYALQTRLDGR
jgi:hypothetical protein